MAEVKVPRFMISAPGSGSGKTTIVCGLLKALMEKGLSVAAFKSGPDYIDPMFHSRVIGAKSRNLDLFMLGQATTRYLVAKNARHADVAVFEGAMGFYDGMGKTTEASAYDLACTCDVPVVLVVNGKGAALSIAATIKGFKEFRSDSHIVGAILNNVNPMSYLFYKDVIEREAGVKLLGYFPVMQDCNFESRHLGLVTAEEIGDLQQIVAKLAAQVAKSVDLDGLLQVAAQAAPLAYDEVSLEPVGRMRVAVAMDKAFCFYYQDALDLLAELGAELVPFSPIADAHLPENISGLVLGGGYPELYAQQLADNKTLLQELKTAIDGGMPCFAECGGFMYLLEHYRDGDKLYSWVGALKGESAMTKKLTRFGYVHLTAQQDNLLCPAGGTINGHEFHYSDSTNNGASFIAAKASGRGSWECANTTPTLYAGYPHIHLWGNPEFARSFIKQCAAYAAK
ncbi:cobyrinic acid A C-diamide synthase [Phascolarctobacterium succinatutens CAG:287]|uniref:Cobyrinate a,c-diamide synthase n=1 Tax=Phascolarctobacterium succinatutens CAG:287 TaxID=1263101 RepID=R6WL08_9FIRM|nr:cobyrinate a,c-diamide synthase [Phascolarctobacterium succinatutens]CDD10050.1 cobyrinic acid A C-diamide synthase [Phascolarctobacterium succinatutens CAG:287]